MWWQYLNPMNWIKLFGLITTVWNAAISLYNQFQEYLKKKHQEQRLDDMKKIEQRLDEVNKIEDENERLKQKAKAASDLEDLLNKP